MRGRRDELWVLGRDRRLAVHVDPAPQAVGVDNLAAVEAGQGTREVAHILIRPEGGARMGLKGAVEQRHCYVADFVRLIDSVSGVLSSLTGVAAWQK